MKYTITSGISKIKDNLRARLNHNYRYEKNHRNVKNNNLNSYLDGGKIKHFTAEQKRATAKNRKKQIEQIGLIMKKRHLINNSNYYRNQRQRAN